MKWLQSMLYNMQSGGPSIVKEGTLVPFGTAQNVLTDLCLAVRSH